MAAVDPRCAVSGWFVVLPDEGGVLCFKTTYLTIDFVVRCLFDVLIALLADTLYNTVYNTLYNTLYNILCNTLCNVLS